VRREVEAERGARQQRLLRLGAQLDGAVEDRLRLVGTPLLGLTFSLPGDGRIGFAVVAALCLATTLVRATPRAAA
jgi:hypothetical protein